MRTQGVVCHVVLMTLPLLLSACQQGEQPAVKPTVQSNKTASRESAGNGSADAQPEAGAKTAELPWQTVKLGTPELTAGIPGEGPLTTDQIQVWLDDSHNHEPLSIELPMWLAPGAGQTRDLKENPMTRAKIELGRQLFFDKRLSADNTISCASCHHPEQGYTVATPVATGINGQQGKRNPPTLLNRIHIAQGEDKQFWDGRAASVEDALLHALLDPTEMADTPDVKLASEQAIATLKDIEGYRLQFQTIYGDMSWQAIGDTMGMFVRCLVTGSSPYDYHREWERLKDADPQWLKEDDELAANHRQAFANFKAHAMTESALRGEQLFFGTKAWCVGCHSGVNLTSESYYNIGIGLDAETPDLGRYNVTEKERDWGTFKTPTIRTALYTAPYMHDGSLKTLADVVEWYASGGRENRNLSPRYKSIGQLTDQEKQDLVEFMKACAGPLPTVETGRLPN